MLSQAVAGADRRVRVRHAHVHVKRAVRRAVDDAAEVVPLVAVAWLLDYSHVAELGGWVDARAHRSAARSDHGRPQPGQLRHRLGCPLHHRRGQLYLSLVDVVADGRRVGAKGVDHARAVVGERVGGGVHEQQLFLHAEREVRPLSERVLHARADSAAVRPNTSAAASPLE